jgi:hypothetical protein
MSPLHPARLPEAPRDPSLGIDADHRPWAPRQPLADLPWGDLPWGATTASAAFTKLVAETTVVFSVPPFWPTIAM